MNKLNLASTENRIEWVDFVKFLGIFLVILGHQSITNNWRITIYSFHMPLFFFLSGYLFSFEKNKNYKKLLNKRLRQLIVPYFAFNVLTYIFWLFVGRKFGAEISKDISIFKPILGMLYGNGINDFLIHCVPLWFLVCLFVVENLYFLLFRFINKASKIILLIGFMLLGYVDSKFHLPRLPWGFNIALVGLVFYGLANVSKNVIDKLLTLRMIVLLPLSLAAFTALLYLSSINGNVDMNNRVYGNYIVFYAVALLGIISTIIICKILGQKIRLNFFIEIIAQNTIIIIAFHSICVSVIKAFLFFILKTPKTVLEAKNGLNILVSITVLVLMIPLIILINKFSPEVIGKRRKSDLAKN